MISLALVFFVAPSNHLLSGMREGGKRTVIVPPDVGYEDIGYNEIPPDATITMEVEVLSVRKPTTTAA